MEKSSKIQSKAWIIWLLSAGFFFAEYFARVSPSVMVPDLMRAFSVNSFTLGSLSAFFYYAYVSMQIPVGTLVDRFGAKRLLTLMASVCGASCLLFSLSHSLHVAELARFCMGFSAAFAFVGALKLASVWFPAKHFGFISGATQALGMLGAAVGEGPVSVLVAHIGWQHSMQLIGAILLVLAVLIFMLVKDKPHHHTNPTIDKPSTSKPSMLHGLATVLRNKQTWLNGLFVGFLYAPTAAFAELWGPSYLQHVHHLSPEIAASAIGMIFIGWAISSPIGGYISDKMQRRKPLMYASALLSCITLAIVLYAPHLSATELFIGLFMYGCVNVGVATSYAVACEIVPRTIAGTSMSFANMASVLIGACFQPIIGRIMDALWTGQYVNGIRSYSAHDYRIAMLALPLCFILSLISCYFLKESFVKTIEKPSTPQPTTATIVG